MLSLLSLIIASGTVLRADTELWEPLTYPDPRTNSTQCNTAEESTLCDPDHILTDTWRQTIQENIAKQTLRLQNVEIQYTDSAPEECRSNLTESVQIYFILAKRIHTASNQSITSNDLTNFGHGLREAFGLDAQSCKNYILILGVELAKEIYVWTGSDLALPKETMDHSLSQYKNLFIERNYMEGLNKIVDEIGDLLADPFKDITTTPVVSEAETSSLAEVTSEQNSTPVSTTNASSAPTWMYVVMIICVVVTLTVLIVVFFFFLRNNKLSGVTLLSLAQGKSPPPDNINNNNIEETGIPTSVVLSSTNLNEENNNNDRINDAIESENEQNEHVHDSSLTIDNPNEISSAFANDRKFYINNAFETAGTNSDSCSKTSKISEYSISKDSSLLSVSESTKMPTPSKRFSQVNISAGELLTDQVKARRNSDTRPSNSFHIDHNFASF